MMRLLRKRLFGPWMKVKNRKGFTKLFDHSRERLNNRYGKEPNNFHILDEFSEKEVENMVAKDNGLGSCVNLDLLRKEKPVEETMEVKASKGKGTLVEA